MTINAKRKGNHGEHEFAHFLIANGHRAYRNSMSGGSVWKGDIGNDLDLTIEIKTVARINLMEAWRQVNRDASTAHNTPVLAIHLNNMPAKEWLVVMHSNDWVELMKKNGLQK